MKRFALIYVALLVLTGVLGLGLIPGATYEIARMFFYVLSGLGALLIIASVAVSRKAS